MNAAALILLALFGTPLFVVILAVAMVGFRYADIDFSIIAAELYRIADTPLLVALPLFTFAGNVLGHSRASQRLVHFTRAFLGWMPGGLAVVAFVTCALFTAFTGASGVTIVALGALLYPALKQDGYGESFSLGLVTSSGSLGLLLPPSLPLILYAIIAQQMGAGQAVTINGLFLAGIFPALLMILFLCAWSLWTNRRHPIPLTRFSGRVAIRALREGIWELPLPLVVLGGIYGGIFVVSEAAAVTALYVVVVAVFIHKEIDLKTLVGVVRESMVMVGGIILILAASLALTNVIIDAEVPMRLFELIREHVTSKIGFLMYLNLFLLGLGAILDIFSALLIIVPLILPVAASYGIDPVHLGIIFLANMQIGYITPPVGMNLFIASYCFNQPVDRLYRAAWPFMLVLLAAVLVITYWPTLSLMLIRP
ncbi:MAG: TRAP transporter large permease subunit [Deltaproteobacteria bacterium]|nr:TRAP transporter large permease subunit [Deltaproteobacteria bacterium]